MAEKSDYPPADLGPYEIQQGETARFTCSVCMTEFDLTPEPKMSGQAMIGDTYTLKACPLCGTSSDSVERDE